MKQSASTAKEAILNVERYDNLAFDNENMVENTQKSASSLREAQITTTHTKSMERRRRTDYLQGFDYKKSPAFELIKSMTNNGEVPPSGMVKSFIIFVIILIILILLYIRWKRTSIYTCKL